MIKSVMLSRFTPSLLEPEVLEAIFVRREGLAARLVELVRESVLTENKHYVLLVGPRGIGKTHLVALVYHRLRQDAALGERLRVAWLREEEWGITSYLDLLLAVLRALGEQHPDAGLAQRSEALVGMAAEQAETEAENAVVEFAAGRTVLLIAENLDEIFRGLGEDGQRKLRAFLQNRPAFTILATSTGLFNGVSLRTSPFYGFFEVHHLDELSLEDAVSLLVKIAEQEGDQELAARLREPAGRARVRALHHLAGGNPRVYVIFSQFLTCELLDQLTDAVLRTLDDLTPYYQARMNFLSPQQRKIVSFLCDRRGAVPVGEIAEGNFLTHQGASSQLRRLLEMGYVRPHQLGRECYYELREPLMRLAMEVKKMRGRPVQPLVEFLRLWYTRQELLALMAPLPAEATQRAYLLEAIRRCEKEPRDPRVSACIKDLGRSIAASDFGHAMEVAEELTAVDVSTGSLVKATLFAQQERYREAVDAYEVFLEKYPPSAIACVTHFVRGKCLFNLRRDVEALASIMKASEMASTYDVSVELRSEICTVRDGLARHIQKSRDFVICILHDADTRPAKELVELLRKNVDGTLFERIPIDGIPEVFDASVGVDKIHDWLRALQEVGVGHDELALPLRLLRAAVEYRETRDQRVLLRLPVEEREILKPLLPE